MDKKMLKIIGIAVGSLVLVIIIVFIIAACSHKKFDFYKFQLKMLDAAQIYYEDKKDELPKEDGDSKSVSLKKLISEGYMKEPSETYKDETLSCDGSVTVLNNSGHYYFSPSLTCNNDMRTQTLLHKIKEDSFVEEGSGLYEVANQLVYRGDVYNNYVKIDGSDRLWRIIRVNEDGTFRLFQVFERGNNKVAWDAHYNSATGTNDGINQFINPDNKMPSTIKEELKDYYDDSELWPDEIKAYILTQNVCIGDRDADDSSKDGSTECVKQVDNQKFGLLLPYEYLIASLEKECVTTVDVSCSNYNWLANINDSIWTSTPVKDSVNEVWYLYGTLDYQKASSQGGMNVVINIPGSVTYVTGDGTEGNPYIIK